MDTPEPLPQSNPQLNSRASHHHDAPTNYSFLVHAHPTSSSNDMTSFDSAQSSRQKRRRTSPQDHKILEAAYQSNSKPDKSERAAIVSQVELGEKEVQIWFQNRRQNDRRKAKPLDPHELISHLKQNPTPNPPSQHAQSDPIPSSSPAQRTSRRLEYHDASNTSTSAPQQTPKTSSSAISIQALTTPPSSIPTASTEPFTQVNVTDVQGQYTPPSSLVKSSAEENVGPQATPGEGAIRSSSPVGSGRKRAHDEMTGGSSQDTELVPNKAVLVEQPRKVLSRSSSMRLSVTADGSMKIRTSDELTPSPPKIRALGPESSGRRSRKLLRAQRTINSSSIFESSAAARPSRGPGSGFGRSRDPRTWEFFCDNSARESLAEQAEAERNGSAVGAINLIRSGSFQSRIQALSPAVGRHNARTGLNARRVEPPGFSRSKSSLARMETEYPKDRPNRQMQNSDDKASSPTGDSDKENWEPGTRSSNHSLRRTNHGTHSRRVLEENSDHMYPDIDQRSGRPTPLTVSKRGDSLGTNEKAVPNKSRAKGEDLDCIQGLLSLSQGAWR